MPSLCYFIFCIDYGQHLLSSLINAPRPFIPFLGRYNFLDFPLSHSYQYEGKKCLYTNKDIRSFIGGGWLNDLNFINENDKNFDFKKKILDSKELQSEIIFISTPGFPYYLPIKKIATDFFNSQDHIALIQAQQEVIGILFRGKEFISIAKRFNTGTFSFRSLLFYVKQHNAPRVITRPEIWIGNFTTIAEYIDLNFNLMHSVNDSNYIYKLLYARCIPNKPMHIHATGKVNHSILSSGCEIRGEVNNSILSKDVIIDKGAIIHNSIILANVHIGEQCQINHCIIGEQKNENNFSIPKGSVLGNIKNNNYIVLGKNVQFNQRLEIEPGVTIRNNQIINKQVIRKGMEV